jgi:hypothetical protein
LSSYYHKYYTLYRGTTYEQIVNFEVRLYGPYEERVIVGAVERVDRLLRRVRIGEEWVGMGDITGVENPGE